MASKVLLMFTAAAMVAVSQGLPPNYEDVEDSREEPKGAKVVIEQDRPQSNAIHVAHNIPDGSDIMIRQTSPHNTSVHVALNIASNCKVKVILTDPVNCALHVSLNNARDSEVEVVVDRPFNTSVHVSFQNPVRTPAKVTLDSPTISHIHLSQNVPVESPAELLITNPKRNQIHFSQSSAKKSPMTFTINGQDEENQIEVSQSAPDSESTLSCNPDCPQPPPVEYDYAYSGGDSQGSSPAAGVHQANNREPSSGNTATGVDGGNQDGTNEFPDYADFGGPGQGQPRQGLGQDSNQDLSCPGGDIKQCIGQCADDLPLIAYKACVKVCNSRCP